MSVEHFRLEQQTKVEGAVRPGIVPIPVPLYSGEKVPQYEQEFRAWLATRGAPTVEELRSDPNKERSYRFAFAKTRLRDPQPPCDSGAEGVDSLTSSLPGVSAKRTYDEASSSMEYKTAVPQELLAKRPRVTRPPSLVSAVSYRVIPKEAEPFARDKAVQSAQSQTEVDSKSKAENDSRAGSSLEIDKHNAATTAGEMEQIPQCTPDMMHRVRQLEEEVKRSSIVTQRIGDLDDGVERTRIAMQRVHDREKEGRTLRQQAGSIDPPNTEQDVAACADHTDDNDVDVLYGPAHDPIKSQLAKMYNHFNANIRLNEKAAANLLELVRDTMFVDMNKALELQSQIKEFRAAVEQESGKRDTALAALIAHCWRYKRDELKKLFTPLGVLDVPLAQRSSHAKCAALSKEIKATNRKIVGWMRDMEDEMRTSIAPLIGSKLVAGDDSRLSKLTARVAAAEKTRDQLELDLQMEYLALFHLSKRVRDDVQKWL